MVQEGLQEMKKERREEEREVQMISRKVENLDRERKKKN